MGNCCGAKAAFGSATAAFQPVMGEAMRSRRAERAVDRFSAKIMPVRPDTNRRGFNFSDGWSAVLVAAFTPISDIDAHLERAADAAIDFENVSMRTFAFLTFRPALQDSQLTNVSDLGAPVGGESD
jgi:hypothetical protein